MREGFIYPPCEPTTPVNLLDNSDFRNPVNQRDKTSYTGDGGWVPCIDRWLVYGDTYIGVNNSGVSLHSASGQAILGQRLRKGTLQNNKQYTLAYMDTNGVLGFGSEIYPSDVHGYDEIWLSFSVDKTIVWAGLYEGTYTADTLPPYVPKGYGNELAECRKHFQRIRMGNGTFMALAFSKTSARTTVYLDEMRVTPTVTTNNPLNLVGRDNVKHTVTGMNVSVIGRTSMALVFTAEGLTSGEVYGAYPLDGNNAANVDFDANI